MARISKRSSKSRSRISRKFGSVNGATPYQNQVNALTGNMGPKNSAFWPNTGTTTGNPWSMGAQPLYFSPEGGRYVTAYEQNAAPQSIAFETLPKSYGVLGSWSKFGSKKKRKPRSRRGSGRGSPRGSKDKKPRRSKKRSYKKPRSRSRRGRLPRGLPRGSKDKRRRRKRTNKRKFSSKKRKRRKSRSCGPCGAGPLVM